MSHTLCPSVQAPPAPPPTPLSLSSSGSVDVVPPSDSVSPSTPPDTLSGLVKRLCGTPERIALENYRPCLQEEDSPLQEVPEETLAQHNLSLSLQEKGSEEQSRYHTHIITHTHTFSKHNRAALHTKTWPCYHFPGICNVAMFSPSFSLGSSSESELEEEGEEPWRRGAEPQTRADGKTELDSRVDQKKEEEKGKDEKEGAEHEDVSEEENEGESSDGRRFLHLIVKLLILYWFLGDI